MKEILHYLRRLEANNNREWFHAHKAEYLAARARFDGFARQLIEGIRRFDAEIGPVTPDECNFRIYRDIRFSRDKRPYKTHLCTFISPGGRKSGYSGYYFHVGLPEAGYESGNILAVGNYYVEPPVLRILREDIEMGEGAFGRIVASADPRLSLAASDFLKRFPSGFDPGCKDAEYLRLKNFCLGFYPDEAFMTSRRMLSETLELFRSATPFLHYLNRAIRYVREEG